MKVKIGDKIGGRYLLRREVSRGPLGGVFEATHQVSGHRVALKLLRARWVGVDSLHARRFREARALGSMTHPSIVAIFDAGDDPVGGPFLALEMLEGRSLAGILAARRALPIADAVTLAARLAEPLAAMHERGFVHRDVRPENVFIVRAGGGVPERLELLDLGSALQRDAGPSAMSVESQAEREATFSPAYEPPERLRGAEGRTPQADLFSWAAVIHAALEGEPAAALAQGAPNAHAPRRPGALTRADVPPVLAELIAACLQQNERDRPADAGVVMSALATLAGVGAELRILGLGQADAPSSLVVESPRRRRHARAPYVTPVRALVQGKTYDGRLEDVSEGGVLAVLPAGLRVGDAGTVRFALPVTGSIVSLPATVAWIKPAREGFDAVGLEISGLAEGARLEVQQYTAMMGVAPPAR